ncbi:uncharacterized protein LOC110731407 isoform X5 [Chenopodium quinoa]|uniref:uncharacterized protein LOC110731407 isoform X5 n=1 Tax=Chenopodium quinoa TaxID=63459 RepID=UPI000B787F6F|nr:uncharacterized protein LOC110731407 isoform X5 [Chenopodium quinoa]
MADAPVNFKRPSSRGRKSKRISDLISNHNSSSQAEQSKSKKAKSRPSKYTVLEKRPVSLRVPPSNAQSSKQLRDAAKKAPAATIGRPLPTQPLELSPPTYCAECGAKKFAFETLHFCCGNGDIKIVANEYPPELVRLFTSRDEDDCILESMLDYTITYLPLVQLEVKLTEKHTKIKGCIMLPLQMKLRLSGLIVFHQVRVHGHMFL